MTDQQYERCYQGCGSSSDASASRSTSRRTQRQRVHSLWTETPRRRQSPQANHLQDYSGQTRLGDRTCQKLCKNVQDRRTGELLRPEQEHRVADAVLRHAGRLCDGAHREHLLWGEHIEGALEAARHLRQDHASLALEACKIVPSEQRDGQIRGRLRWMLRGNFAFLLSSASFHHVILSDAERKGMTIAAKQRLLKSC